MVVKQSVRRPRNYCGSVFFVQQLIDEPKELPPMEKLISREQALAGIICLCGNLIFSIRRPI